MGFMGFARTDLDEPKVEDYYQADKIIRGKNVFLEGLERRALLDSGVWKTRDAVCICRNEEMFSAMMQKECTSFYIELEDALEYMNPVLLRLIHERGDKVLEKDSYESCLEAFTEQYMEINAPAGRSVNGERTEESLQPELFGMNEWRTYKECLEDFAACMKYLKMQGYKRKKAKQPQKKQMDIVLDDIRKNAGEKLYWEFMEIVDND